MNKSANKKRTIPPPLVNKTPTNHREPNIMDSIMRTTAEGFFFGAGSTMGSSVIRKMGELIPDFSDKEIVKEREMVTIIPSTKDKPCESIFERYNDCMILGHDISICSKILEEK